MKKILPCLLFCFLCFHEVSASVLITAVLPNPIGDDTLGEYIEVRNSGCIDVDVSNYLIRDASGKAYSIPLGIVLHAHENRKFFYNETKISLNNSGEETIVLNDFSGEIIDIISYSGAQSEGGVLEIANRDEICTFGGENTGSLLFTGSENTLSGILSSTEGFTQSGTSFSGETLEISISGSILSVSGILDNSGLLITESGNLLFESGMLENYTGLTLSGNILEMQTGTIADGEASSSGIESVGSGRESTRTGEILEIVPTLQSPTNALFSSGVFICNSMDCKVNITLAPIFQSGNSLKNYTCSFGTGTEMILDSDCNPNTYSFTETGVFSLEIVSKVDNVRYRRDFPVIFLPQLGISDDQIEVSENTVVDTGKPVAIITMDGKWKEYYETIGDYELNCYALTCSLNFSAEKSYDPEGSSIRYLWIYGPNEIKTSKDPGTFRYGLGDHRLTLRVIDQDENYDERVYKIHVLGAKQKAPIQKNEKVSLKKTLNQVASQGIVMKKKYKKLKMEFFSPPQIVLQGKTGKKLRDGSYQCLIKTAKNCSLNFTLTGALNSLDYQWYLDGSPIFRGKNPHAWKLSTGKHTLELQTFLKGSIIPLEKQSYAISVLRSPKKVKKSTRSSVKKPKSEKKYSLIPEAQASNAKNTSASADSLIIYGILIAGFGTGYLLRSRKKGNHSS